MASETTAEHLAKHADPGTHAEHEREEHPSDWQYIKVGIFLAVVTAIEVGLYYFELPAFNNYALLVLAAIKFVFVVLWFMHLKFDNVILRRIFAVGFVLAVGVYAAFLIMFSWIQPFTD